MRPGHFFGRLSSGVAKRWGLYGDATSPKNGGQEHVESNGNLGGRKAPVAAIGGCTVDESVKEKYYMSQSMLGSCRGRVGEVLGFLGWVALIAVAIAQIPLLWYVFWEYICIYGSDEAEVGHRLTRQFALPLWIGWITALGYYRSEFRRRAPPGIFDIMIHGEIFICVGVAMTLCVNFASFMHTPGPLLFDVGFLVIPEQAKDSPWRPVSDILTAALPGIALVRSLWLDRKQRCKVVCDWFRLISIVYLFRCLTVALTSLPGPAPQCETFEGYNPPQGWHDIATRLGPMMGDFKTCGDLIFSGHTAWTTVTMLLAVKSFRSTRYYRLVKLAGLLYLMAMCLLAIAGRKHYTVDVALAILIASLTFFRFQDGWNWQIPEDALGSGNGAYAYGYVPVRKCTTIMTGASTADCGLGIV